ncbi:MAG: hypothetical protein LC776_11910 [Acidobacteria bacterium]|nr:hypothetical protein [Acidobacteriota bacterium]
MTNSNNRYHPVADPYLGGTQYRFVILQKVPYDRCAERVALLLSKAAQRLPEHLWRSITT